MTLDNFMKQGKASFILGGQYGSEGKGGAAAFTAVELARRNKAFEIITANNGANSGHTSIHGGKKEVLFHLPTASIYPVNGIHPITYLNAGAIIDPVLLLLELSNRPKEYVDKFFIHPNAAIITQECKDAEGRADSAQTKIASTRKGVGEALSRKVLRSGMVAKEHLLLQPYIKALDLNDMMLRGLSVLVEIPQGHSLSIDGGFYPHTTSRNCTVMQAMSDAGIHPHFYHRSMLVARTFPIRVGNIGENSSGGHFPDQQEVGWESIGVDPEITTVTKRVRRVFTFSEQQFAAALAQTRPHVIYLTFMDYLPKGTELIYVDRIRQLSRKHGLQNCDPEIVTQWGPSTDDVITGTW